MTSEGTVEPGARLECMLLRQRMLCVIRKVEQGLHGGGLGDGGQWMLLRYWTEKEGGRFMRVVALFAIIIAAFAMGISVGVEAWSWHTRQERAKPTVVEGHPPVASARVE
jgi:hypothetical protein